MRCVVTDHSLLIMHTRYTQALVLGYMKLDGIRQACPDMLAGRLHRVYQQKPVQWSLYREITSMIDTTTKNLERSSLHELRLNEVSGVSNDPLVQIYEKAAPKSRGKKRKLHGSSPSLLWNRNGPEMTCLATIADLKEHEALMYAKAKDKAERKAKRFVEKVIRIPSIYSMPSITRTFVLTHSSFVFRLVDTAKPKRRCVIGWCTSNWPRMDMSSILRIEGRRGQNAIVPRHHNAITSFSTCTRATT